jgi:hypothetical protein
VDFGASVHRLGDVYLFSLQCRSALQLCMQLLIGLSRINRAEGKTNKKKNVGQKSAKKHLYQSHMNQRHKN